MTRFSIGLLLAAAATASAQPPAAAPAPALKRAYGHDFKVRNPGEANFTPTTPKVAVEFFREPAGNALLVVTEDGHLAAVPLPDAKPDAKVEWAFAHEVRSRKADQEGWKDAQKVAMEAFKDPAPGRLVYVTDRKTVAAADVPANLLADKDPAFHHGLILKVRGAAATDLKGAKAFGVEAYKDGNTGGLVYVSETGSIACGPAPASPPADGAVQPPRLRHGLTLTVRKGDQKAFAAAAKVSVEVFEDRNTGGLVYVSDTGSIAVAPLGQYQAQATPEWKTGMWVQVRKPGVATFESTPKLGIELYEDRHTGHRIYVSETGSIAVVAKQ